MLEHSDLLSRLHCPELSERLVVSPLLDEEQVGPASIDLRLGAGFLEAPRLERAVTDPFEDISDRKFVVPFGDRVLIHPGQFLLGTTFEYIRMPHDLAGEVLNRSSWARIGLLVATAVVIHPGYSGTLTLELVNTGATPLPLVAGVRIGQLVVWQLPRATDKPYDARPKYDALVGPHGSRLGTEASERARMKEVGRLLRGGGEAQNLAGSGLPASPCDPEPEPRPK